MESALTDIKGCASEVALTPEPDNVCFEDDVESLNISVSQLEALATLAGLEHDARVARVARTCNQLTTRAQQVYNTGRSDASLRSLLEQLIALCDDIICNPVVAMAGALRNTVDRANNLLRVFRRFVLFLRELGGGLHKGKANVYVTNVKSLLQALKEFDEAAADTEPNFPPNLLVPLNRSKEVIKGAVLLSQSFVKSRDPASLSELSSRVDAELSRLVGDAVDACQGKPARKHRAAQAPKIDRSTTSSAVEATTVTNQQKKKKDDVAIGWQAVVPPRNARVESRGESQPPAAVEQPAAVAEAEPNSDAQSLRQLIVSLDEFGEEACRIDHTNAAIAGFQRCPRCTEPL